MAPLGPLRCRTNSSSRKLSPPFISRRDGGFGDQAKTPRAHNRYPPANKSLAFKQISVQIVTSVNESLGWVTITCALGCIIVLALKIFSRRLDFPLVVCAAWKARKVPSTFYETLCNSKLLTLLLIFHTSLALPFYTRYLSVPENAVEQVHRIT